LTNLLESYNLLTNLKKVIDTILVKLRETPSAQQQSILTIIKNDIGEEETYFLDFDGVCPTIGSLISVICHKKDRQG
jgi:hypothetical protein